MDDATWQRHASPWSGWTRVATMPLLTLAIWSRTWIGAWALVPVALLLIWTWVNPRLFPVPRSTDNWMSRGVLGERIWLADRDGQIARHHHLAIRMTTLIASTGAVAWVLGLIWLNLTATATGLCTSVLGKLWFIDRMVWIQREFEASDRRES